MKNLLLITIFSFVIISCSKEDENIVTPSNTECQGSGAISYQDSLFYGLNILNLPDSSIVSDTGSYSFSATLDCSANLKIRIQNLSTSPGPGPGPYWGYVLGSADGWMVAPYTSQDSSQTFQSNTNNTSKTLMLNMVFGGTGFGFARIDFYENSTSVTKSKYFYW
ncbi:MAG: hypothetical protein P1U41_05800 [Vicingaceae bacterium]|nr:hypothetical protein [Vicingaceae bacterium]